MISAEGLRRFAIRPSSDGVRNRYRVFLLEVPGEGVDLGRDNYWGGASWEGSDEVDSDGLGCSALCGRC